MLKLDDKATDLCSQGSQTSAVASRGVWEVSPFTTLERWTPLIMKRIEQTTQDHIGLDNRAHVFEILSIGHCTYRSSQGNNFSLMYESSQKLYIIMQNQARAWSLPIFPAMYSRVLHAGTKIVMVPKYPQEYEFIMVDMYTLRESAALVEELKTHGLS